MTTKREVIDTILHVKAAHNGKKYSANQVRSYIFSNLEEINDAFKYKLSKKDIPGKRTIERIIANNPDKIEEIKLRIKKNYDTCLDKRWSIGNGLKHGISNNVIPLLIRIRSKLKKHPLTVRHARWISYLYPAIERLVNEQYPDNIEEQDKRYILIPREYALREKFCSDMERDFDTSDFDTLFFEYRDISEEAIGYAMADNVLKDNTKIPYNDDLLEKGMEELEQILGRKITETEYELFQGYLKAFAQSAINGKMYVHEHAENLVPLISELQSKAKDGE